MKYINYDKIKNSCLQILDSVDKYVDMQKVSTLHNVSFTFAYRYIDKVFQYLYITNYNI